MPWTLRALGPLLALGLTTVTAGCVVGRATSSLYDIPRERATECQEICTKLDLQMAAVVVIMNTTGCVCEPRTAHAPAPTGAAPPTGAAVGSRPSGSAAAIAAAQVIATQAAQQSHVGGR